MSTPREFLPSLEDAFGEIHSRLHQLSHEELVQTLFRDFVRREANGQTPDHAVYLERFPAVRDQLERYFEVHFAMSDGDLADISDALLPQDELSETLLAAGKQGATEPIDLALGDYRVVREIARGGMGIVYEAEQLSLGRRVALKTLHRIASIDERKRQRFLNEAQAASTINADGIVPVISVGEEKGICYFAMPFIDGADLGRVMTYLRRRQAAGEQQASAADGNQSDDEATKNVVIAAGLDDDESVRFYGAIAKLGSTLAVALDQAHQVGIIHRDVKPSNILLDKTGKPWISDFGLAHLESSETLTRSGDVLGTYQYMSPEQASGNAARVDCRSDVYSLGATLYEVLTREPPFAAYKPPRLLRAVLEDEPIPPRKHAPRVPQDLETVVLKATSKEPLDRYGMAQAMADDLSRFAKGEPIQARKLGMLDRCGRWLHRHRKIAASLAGVLIVAAISAFTALQFHAAKLNVLNLKLRQEQLVLAKLLYANNVRSAFEALDRNDTAKVVDVVKRQETSPATTVPTGIEWSLLKKITSQYEPELVLTGHDGSVNELASVPGKPWVVTVGDDQTARIWNLETGKQIFKYTSDDGVLCAVAVSPDGEHFATGCRTLQLFELATGEPMRTITTHASTIESIAFSRTGDQIASGSRYKSIHLNSRDGQLIASSQNEARNEMLMFTKDDNLLVGSAREVTSKYEFIRMWDAADQLATIVRDIKTDPYATYRFFAGSRDGRWIAAGGPNAGSLDFFDVASGITSHSIPGRGNHHLSALATTHDGQHCAAAFVDGSIRYWQLQPEATSSWIVPGSEHSFIGHEGQINSLCFLANGKLVSCGRDGLIKLWPKLKRRFSLAGQQHRLWWTMDVGANDRVALVTYSPPKCQVRIGTVDGEDWIESDLPTSVGAVRFGPDGTHLAVGGEGRVYLLDAGNLQVVKSTQQLNEDGSVHAIGGLAFSGDGRWLASGGGDSICLRDATTLEPLHKWQLQCACVAFSPEARRLACGDRAGVTTVLDTTTANATMSLMAMSGVTSVRWPPGLNIIVTGHTDGKIIVWDATTGDRKYLLNEHSSLITDLSFSPDARTLFSCAADATVRIWHLDTGSPLGILYRETHDADLPIAGLRFLKASKSIVIARCDSAGEPNLLLWPWE